MLHVYIYTTTRFIMKTKMYNCECHYKNYDD